MIWKKLFIPKTVEISIDLEIISKKIVPQEIFNIKDSNIGGTKFYILI